MRIGAIFARGSCRALKWMALFGLVFAVGAGTAAAQTTGVTITGPSQNTVNEGGTATYTVAIRGYVGVATDADTPNNPAAFDVTLGTPAPNSDTAGEEGEPADLNSNGHVLTVSFDPPSNSSTTNRLLFTGSKTVSLATLHDNDAENERFTLAFTALSGVAEVFTTADTGTSTPISLPANAPTLLIIDDDETQTYTLTQTTRNPTEGAAFMVELKASPPHEDGTGTLTVNIDKQSGWTLAVAGEAPTTDDTDSTENATTVTGADATRVITITQEAGDGNRAVDTVTVTAYTGRIGASVEQASLSIDVADANALQAVTAMVVNADGVADDPQPTAVEEGETVKIAVMPVDKDGKVTTANEKLTIALAPAGTADARDFRLGGAITIESGQNNSNVVDLIVETDEDVGMETLVLDATVSGEAANGTETNPVAGVLMLDITDATDKRIQPKAQDVAYPLIQDPMNDAAGDDGLNPGESFPVEMDKLFTLMDGYTATYSADSDGSAVSTTERGDVVTITAEEQGSSKVTITGTASLAASSFAPSQTVSNVASITFEVMVVDKMLTVMVTADPPMIDEGGTSMITATASRAVTAADGEVTIELDVVGNATLDMESVTIAMGDMSASAMLTAGEDDDYDDETVTVVATGDGITGTMQVEIMVNDTDEAPVVPATVTAKSQDEVDMVFAAAVPADWTEGGDAVMVDMSALFDTESTTVIYSSASDDMATVGTSDSGSMVTLTPMAAGSATITVTAADTESGDSAMASSMVMVAAIVLDPIAVMSVMADPMEIMEGGMSTITATLNRAVTADDGEVMVGLSVVGDATLDMDSIMIAAGAMSGSAMLTATEDDDYMDETVTVVATGPGITGTMQIEIAVTDNDDAPVVEPTVRAKDGAAMMIADAIATAAGGADWMVGGMAATVDMSMLFDVDAGVTAAYSGVSSMNDVVRAMSSGNMLTLTPMSAGSSTITVTASDPASMDVATVSHDAMVVLQTLVVTVMASADMVDEGGSVMITASTNRDVTADTMLTLTVTGDTAAVSAPDMLTIAMGSDSGMAEVMAVEDDDTMDANVTVVVTGSALAAPVSLPIAVTDNDRTVNPLTQAEVDAVFIAAIAVASGGSNWVPGGNAAMVDMSKLFSMEAGATVEYKAESSADDMVMASASGMMLTLTPMATGDATIMVTATDTSGDADDHAMVSSMVTVGVLPLEIMVSPTTAEVEEGGMVEITATANKMVDANVEVMLLPDVTGSTAGDDDYSLAPSAMITIMAGEASGMATLTATDDYEVEGNESLTLVARVKDMGDIGTVTVSIMDNDMETTYTLSGPPDMNLVEGMSYELKVTANQKVHMDTEVMLMRDRAASDAGDDDYTVGSIMIAADADSGTTMLMVTEDNMPDAGEGTNMGESLVLVGSVDGMEIGTLEFTIWDAAVPALPIIAQLLLAALLGVGGYRRYLRRR